MNSRKAVQRFCGCALVGVLLLSAAGRAEAPLGSTYVPIDSWVYPAFDRLAALGAINKQFVGLRPWSRIQCAQLVLDAEEILADADTPNPEATKLYDALSKEFGEEINRVNGNLTRQAKVESLYTRSIGISGTPLRDGWNFGQTLDNDFGRPFNTGFNNVTGISAQAASGRFFAYAQCEYQHSPAYAGLTLAQQAYLEEIDVISSVPYSQATRAVDRVGLLDAYVGV
jgi:hypothetical protein